MPTYSFKPVVVQFWARTRSTSAGCGFAGLIWLLRFGACFHPCNTSYPGAVSGHSPICHVLGLLSCASILYLANNFQDSFMRLLSTSRSLIFLFTLVHSDEFTKTGCSYPRAGYRWASAFQSRPLRSRRFAVVLFEGFLSAFAYFS